MKMTSRCNKSASQSGSMPPYTPAPRFSKHPFQAQRPTFPTQQIIAFALRKTQSYFDFSGSVDRLGTVVESGYQVGTYSPPQYGTSQQRYGGYYQSRYPYSRPPTYLPDNSMDDLDLNLSEDDEYMSEPEQPQQPRFIHGKQVLYNKDITAPIVRVITSDGGKSVMRLEDAMSLAKSSKTDLLLLNPDTTPPLCRLCSWSKYKFELDKEEKTKAAKSSNVTIKEIRLRPKTDTGDLATKMKSAQKHLEKGNKIKLVMKFEGRELSFKDQGKAVMMKFVDDLNTCGKIDGPINFKSGTFAAMINPTGKIVKETDSSVAAAAQPSPTADTPTPVVAAAGLTAPLPLPPQLQVQAQQHQSAGAPRPPSAPASGGDKAFLPLQSVPLSPLRAPNTIAAPTTAGKPALPPQSNPVSPARAPNAPVHPSPRPAMPARPTVPAPVAMPARPTVPAPAAMPARPAIPAPPAMPARPAVPARPSYGSPGSLPPRSPGVAIPMPMAPLPSRPGVPLRSARSAPQVRQPVPASSK